MAQKSNNFREIDWFESPSGGPRWKHKTKHLQNLTKEQQYEAIDGLCLKYAPWFFEVLTEVKIGENLQLEDFQIAYLLDDSSFKVTNKSRQAGGSLILAGAKFFKAYMNESYKCDIVSVTRSEAQSKIRYIRDMWESLPMRWRLPLSVDNTESIGFHSGRAKSVIRSIAASSGVRGGEKDIVFDEAAFIPQFSSTFVGALPATIRGNGSFDVTSTPLGMGGKFYEIFENVGGQFDEFSRHEFAWWDVSFFCKDTKAAHKRWTEDYGENRIHLRELLEEFGTERLKSLVSNLTNEEYEQEFCCVFVDESAAFYTYDLIQPLRKFKSDAKEILEPWTHRPVGNENVVTMGIDFAQGKKGGDSTSIQIFEFDDMVSTYKQRHYEDLNHENGYNSFDRQLTRINELIESFNPTRVRVDGTGLGMKLAEDLKDKHGTLIEVVIFNNHNKEQMALNMKNLMEREQIWLQYENERIVGQIHNIKRAITPSGAITYSGHPHDDMFWAMCLACKNDAYKRFRIITHDGEYS